MVSCVLRHARWSFGRRLSCDRGRPRTKLHWRVNRMRRAAHRSCQPGRRMDASVSKDTDAILVFFVYAQFCVCAIPRYPTYPVSAILDMCKYVQYMQYNHVLRRRSPRGDPGSPRQTCPFPCGDCALYKHRALPWGMQPQQASCPPMHSKQCTYQRAFQSADIFCPGPHPVRTLHSLRARCAPEGNVFIPGNVLKSRGRAERAHKIYVKVTHFQ